MRHGRIGKYLATGCATAALALGLTTNAVADPGYAERTDSSSYSNADVVALFFDGSGPIANENPTLVTKLGYVEETPDMSKRQILTLTDEVEREIPDFTTLVAEALVSGDPYRVESAVGLLEEASSNVSAGPEVIATADDNVGNIIVTPNAGATVETLSIVKETTLWTANAFWLDSVNTNDYDRDALVADISRELSSESSE